jgi:hypothetical protein
VKALLSHELLEKSLDRFESMHADFKKSFNQKGAKE